MPPEWFSTICNDPAINEGAPRSPGKARAGGGRNCREAADVWGLGTLTFELATARIAGGFETAAVRLSDQVR